VDRAWRVALGQVPDHPLLHPRISPDSVTSGQAVPRVGSSICAFGVYSTIFSTMARTDG